MIFWVMLLTFVVSIMTLALYPREDMVNVQEKPLAEVPVRPFIDMHQMAKQIASAQIAAGNAISGNVFRGNNLPLYNQNDVGSAGGSEFQSYLICQTAEVNCDPNTGDCPLTRNFTANCRLPNVICYTSPANPPCDDNGSGANPRFTNCDTTGIISDGACPDTVANGETWVMNFVVTYAPYHDYWNSINYGPAASIGQLWTGELYRLSGKSGNCGVVHGSQIIYPGGQTAINANVAGVTGILQDGSMICQSPIPPRTMFNGYVARRNGLFFGVNALSQSGEMVEAEIRRLQQINSKVRQIELNDICTIDEAYVNATGTVYCYPKIKLPTTATYLLVLHPNATTSSGLRKYLYKSVTTFNNNIGKKMAITRVERGSKYKSIVIFKLEQ